MLADIDQRLASGDEEAVVYRQVNAALFPRTGQPMTNQRVAHGAHVLDLAAGAAPWGNDPMAEVPILAVQLPPAAVRDTAGTGWALEGPLAAMSSVVEVGGQALLHLALGPTVGAKGLPASPSGAWRVEVRPTLAGPVRLTAKVQRDDTPPGYRTLGRQSWLDHPQGWDWDDESRAYNAPRALSDAPGCPVTREGSGVAYAGVQHPHILFVGSVRPRIGVPGKVRPAIYSSEGVVHLARPGESRGPTLVARGDDGVLLAGRAAAAFHADPGWCA